MPGGGRLSPSMLGLFTRQSCSCENMVSPVWGLCTTICMVPETPHVQSDICTFSAHLQFMTGCMLLVCPRRHQHYDSLIGNRPKQIAGEGHFPSFDHAVGDPKEAEIHIKPQHRIVLIEGNYLLLGKERLQPALSDYAHKLRWPYLSYVKTSICLMQWTGRQE